MRKWLVSIIAATGLLMAPLVAQAADYAEVLDKVVDKVSNGLVALTEAMSSAAPKAWELVVLGNWTEAAVNVSIAAAFTVIFFVALAVSAWSFRKSVLLGNLYKEQGSNGKVRYDDYEAYLPGGIIGMIIAGVSLLIMVVITVNNLAMFVSPEAMTARDFLFRAIGR